MPIARSTLEAITSVSRRSQRTYEQRVGVEVRHNFTIGERASEANTQSRAWQKGNALFKLKDYLGYQGRKGTSYLAWQLPNSYSGCHQKQPKGHQKRINRKLADLFMKGMTGNGKTEFEKRYYAKGSMAARAYNRCPDGDLFWPGNDTDSGEFTIWWTVVGSL